MSDSDGFMDVQMDVTGPLALKIKDFTWALKFIISGFILINLEQR